MADIPPIEIKITSNATVFQKDMSEVITRLNSVASVANDLTAKIWSMSHAFNALAKSAKDLKQSLPHKELNAMGKINLKEGMFDSDNSINKAIALEQKRIREQAKTVKELNGFESPYSLRAFTQQNTKTNEEAKIARSLKGMDSLDAYKASLKEKQDLERQTLDNRLKITQDTLSKISAAEIRADALQNSRLKGMATKDSLENQRLLTETQRTAKEKNNVINSGLTTHIKKLDIMLKSLDKQKKKLQQIYDIEIRSLKLSEAKYMTQIRQANAYNKALLLTNKVIMSNTKLKDYQADQENRNMARALKNLRLKNRLLDANNSKYISVFLSIGKYSEMFSQFANQMIGGLRRITFALGVAGMSLTSMLTYPLTNLIKQTLAFESSIELATLKLSKMFGTKQATKMMDIFIDLGEYTSLYVEDIIKGGSILASAGMGADEIIETTSYMVDLVTTAEEYTSALDAMGTMKAANKVSKQQAKRLSNATIPYVEAIAKFKNISEDKVLDILPTITFDELNASLKALTNEGGRFEGMADKLSKTLYGRWSTLLDKIRNKARTAFEPLIIGSKVLIELALSLVDKIDKMTTKQKLFVSLFTLAAVAIGPILMLLSSISIIFIGFLSAAVSLVSVFSFLVKIFPLLLSSFTATIAPAGILFGLLLMISFLFTSIRAESAGLNTNLEKTVFHVVDLYKNLKLVYDLVSGIFRLFALVVQSVFLVTLALVHGFKALISLIMYPVETVVQDFKDEMMVYLRVIEKTAKAFGINIKGLGEFLDDMTDITPKKSSILDMDIKGKVNQMIKDMAPFYEDIKKSLKMFAFPDPGQQTKKMNDLSTPKQMLTGIYEYGTKEAESLVTKSVVSHMFKDVDKEKDNIQQKQLNVLSKIAENTTPKPDSVKVIVNTISDKIAKFIQPNGTVKQD